MTDLLSEPSYDELDDRTTSIPRGMPPHDKKAERAVLGAMLRSQSAIADVADAVHATDFLSDDHQIIFSGIIGLWDGHKPVDSVMLADRLQREGRLDAAGGHAYLADLYDAVATSGAAEYYAGIVRDRSIQRQLIHAGREIATNADRLTGDVGEILAAAEQSILSIADMGASGQAVGMPQAVAEAFDDIDARHERMRSAGLGARGVASPWCDLDEITSGWQDGELIVVAARPSVGKTAFGLGLAHHAAVRLDVPTLFVSLEQSRSELVQRLLCVHSRIDGHRLRMSRLTSEESQALCVAGDDLRQVKLWFDDSPGQNMLRIAASARRLKARSKIGLVVLDYLQLIEGDRGNKNTTRQEQVSGISRRLKHLARELSIPVVALAQVNRQSEARTDRKPRLSDLRESGAIEQDADVVLVLHRPDDDEAPQATQKIEVDVAKQRNGPTGSVLLQFRRACMRFENYDGERS